MSIGVQIRKKLDEFVREKLAEGENAPVQASRFGFSREGSYINSWEMNYRRIGYYSHSYILRDFINDSPVQITVPTTGTGVAPSAQEPQPFGWSGNINEYTAELAVWWAFELLSDDEAGKFLRDNKPVVIFSFFEGGRFCELVTRFNGEIWIAESIS
jgi:hypothetical protein